jgi:hypothetical protein
VAKRGEWRSGAFGSSTGRGGSADVVGGLLLVVLQLELLHPQYQLVMEKV